MDLDDMLDDIDIDTIESKPTEDEIFAAASATITDNDDFGDDDLQAQMEMAELAEWTKAISDISQPIRDKWTNLVKVDNKTVNTNKMQPSYAYKMWNGYSSNTKENVKSDSGAYKPTTSTVLHEMIRKSCSKVGNIEETKIAKLIALTDPLKGQTGRHINKEFSKEIVNDNKLIISNDCNYSEETFPNLKSALEQ